MFKDLLIILIFAFLEVGVFLFLMGTFDVHISRKLSYGSEHKKYIGFVKVICGIVFIIMFFVGLSYTSKIKIQYLITMYDHGKIENVYTGWDFSTDGISFSYTDEDGEHIVDFTGKEITHEMIK